MPRFFAFMFTLLLAAPAWALPGASPPRGPAHVPGEIRGTVTLVILGFLFVLAVVTGVKRVLRKNTVNDMLPRLAALDPAWDTRTMLERVQVVFAKVQNAWAKRDMALAKDALTPQYMERLQFKLECRAARDVRNVVERVQLLRAELYQVDDRLDDTRDTFRALMTFEAVDYDVNMATTMLAKDASTDLRTFVQGWIFARSGDTWVLSEIEDSDDDILFAPPSRSETLYPSPPPEDPMPFYPKSGSS
jgi:hypothetical protein